MLSQVIGISALVIVFLLLIMFSQEYAISKNQRLDSDSQDPYNLVNFSNNVHKIVQIKENVTERNNLFYPYNLKINPGETIGWINNDSHNHTIISSKFKSGLLYPNSLSKNSSFEYNFSEPGIYVYHDQFNPSFRGIIYVGVDETQKELINTLNDSQKNIFIEIPYNTAYSNPNSQYYIPISAISVSGDRITWINNDYISHTATASDYSFDSSVIEAFGSYSIKVIEKGAVTYYCKIHPWMEGLLNVVQK